MVTQVSAVADSAQLEQNVRGRIETLSYLPTTSAVAVKFIELGKDPASEPSDYAQVISGDSSLSSKLLALSNSSWFGVRNKITNVKMAVNLLGLGTVRKLAISYCMAGLHNELGLEPEESRAFWESSLIKAVAAQQYARGRDAKLADDAFAAGLFQDFAITIMFIEAKQQMQAILEDEKADWQAKLERERVLFHLDHTELGRVLAQKMDLPELFIDIVAFHHNQERLGEFVENEVVADAAYAASLFPHLSGKWNAEDAQTLRRFIDDKPLDGFDFDRYLTSIQEEFGRLYRFFEEGEPPCIRLKESINKACSEIADNTEHLVGKLNEMMHESITLGMEINQVRMQKDEIAERSLRDPLTQAYNRTAFDSFVNEQLQKAYRYNIRLAMLYVDVDRFKSINDRFGHDYGDKALRQVADRIRESTRSQDVLTRMGGDEFVLFLYDINDRDATRIAERIVASIAECKIGSRSEVKFSVSAGLITARPMDRAHRIDLLLNMADKLMYQSKKAGGNRVTVRNV